MRRNAAARLRGTLAPAPLWSSSARGAVQLTSWAASRLYSSQPGAPQPSGDPAPKGAGGDPAGSSLPNGGAPEPNKQHEGSGGGPDYIRLHHRPPRSPIMTWIKAKLLLYWLEHAVSDFKRDEFLEGAAMAFRALMEKFPPDNPERFKDVLSPPMYDIILLDQPETPLRYTSELQDLLNFWIKDVDIALPVEGEHSIRQVLMSGEPPTLPIPVQIAVRFNCIEKITTKVEVKDKPPKIVSDNLTVQRHEWLFGGNLNTNESPNWTLLSVQ